MVDGLVLYGKMVKLKNEMSIGKRIKFIFVHYITGIITAKSKL